MRRFTRLTNAFSKKFENHMHMVALYTVFYNSCRIHKTLRMTPAMAAGLTDSSGPWTNRRADRAAPAEAGQARPYKKHSRQSKFQTETLPEIALTGKVHLAR